jgi:hypothetical protein
MTDHTFMPTVTTNTPEASGTAREAPCTGCGTSSDVGTQSAPRPLLDFEAEVSALEKSGVLNGPIYVGIDFGSGTDICAKYAATSASFAASDSASNDISESSKASI